MSDLFIFSLTTWLIRMWLSKRIFSKLCRLATNFKLAAEERAECNQICNAVVKLMKFFEKSRKAEEEFEDEVSMFETMIREGSSAALRFASWVSDKGWLYNNVFI